MDDDDGLHFSMHKKVITMLRNGLHVHTNTQTHEGIILPSLIPLNDPIMWTKAMCCLTTKATMIMMVRWLLGALSHIDIE